MKKNSIRKSDKSNEEPTVTIYANSQILSKPSNAESDVETKRNYLVVQHNKLIQDYKGTVIANNTNTIMKNSASLTLTEKRLFIFLISRIKPDTDPDDFMIFKIREFADVFGIDPDNHKDLYKRIKSAALSLACRKFWLRYPDREVTVGLLDKVEILPKQGAVKVRFDTDLIPYIQNLTSNFFSYRLINIVCFQSKYAIFLYEILKSYCYRGNLIVFNLDDLRDRLDCSNYTSFTNFQNRVIKPALEEINAYSDLFVRAYPIKTGHKFTDIKFFIVDLSDINHLPKSDAIDFLDEAKKRFYRLDQEIHHEESSLYDALKA